MASVVCEPTHKFIRIVYQNVDYGKSVRRNMQENRRLYNSEFIIVSYSFFGT